MSMRSRLLPVALSLPALCVGWGLGASLSSFQAAEATRAATLRRRTPVVEAVEHAAPAVVSVTARTGGRWSWTEGAGAGVIVHPGGYVVTNSHVIRGASQIVVDLFRGSGSFQASVVRDRPAEDLALLRIQGNGRKSFPYVSCCAVASVLLGETAIAVGNPRGLGDSVTVGVVSAVGRDARMSNGVALRGMIQTDAPINTGNSGGALLNADGELIGVIVSLLPHSSGIAFAIPATRVCALVKEALGGTPPPNPLPSITRAPSISALRVEESDLQRPFGERELRTSEESDTSPLRPSDYGLHLHDDGVSLQVRWVKPDSAAARAGVEAGDVLLAVDGRPVESVLDALLSFSRTRPGQVYQVMLRRGHATHRLHLQTPDS